jgi:hypothetical protein
MRLPLTRLITSGLLLAALPSAAATFQWAGGKSPAKKGNTPGRQGDFIVLDEVGEWSRVVHNVQRRFPRSKPWVTWAVGPLREKAATISDDQRKHEEHLNAFDEEGVAVFLEIWPAKGDDVPKQIDEWLDRFKKHPSVAGLSVDLEWHRGVDDATAEAWNKAVKAHDPKYRLMLKHWDLAAMPREYAKKSDVICVDTSSEVDMAGMAQEFATWANELAPAAVGFQTGYPWDEGWWKDLKDPIQDLGGAILKDVKSPTQEIGLLWVTVKSPLTERWDLTVDADRPSTGKGQ